MKNGIVKKTIAVACIVSAIIVGTNYFTFKRGYLCTLAHSSQLDITYDSCIPESYLNSNDIGDGEDEKWYELIKNGESVHLPHSSNGPSEIIYCFSETAQNDHSSITWNILHY